MFMTTYSLEVDYFTGRDLTEDIITVLDKAEEPRRRSYVPTWPLYVHSFAGMVQMSSSTLFHLFGCRNSHDFNLLQRIDYAGIALMIASSATPPIYYGFVHSNMVFQRYFWLFTIWTSVIVAGYVNF
jgi:predicted membrane channel-forming protein YqfA (hemolysin III family)